VDASELKFEQKLDLVRLMMELRDSPSLAVVGLLELRNLLSNLFPDFAAVRDQELDTLLLDYAESLAAATENLTQADDDEDYDDRRQPWD
jgi:hypothetical protein